VNKFIEIKKSESDNYLGSGYFVVTNTSNDWIYLTKNLHYVRKNAVVAVSELDASLEKQESKGLVKIQRPSVAPSASKEEQVVEAVVEAPGTAKKSKKASKASDEVETATDPVDVVVEVAEAPVEVAPDASNAQETPASTDTADENKDVEVQETA
jgi:hypothetical protein